MGKKIGILTFHTPDNYGAVCQAYALQTYLEEYENAKVEIIDFCTDAHLKSNRIFKTRSQNLLKNIVLHLFTCARFCALQQKKNRVSKFRQSLLHLSKHRYNTEEDLLHNILPYDFYISGSDQVFNPNIKYWKVYYLKFPKKGSKKIAYAPSFGISTFTDDITGRILPLLEDFDYLSCREKQGAEYLSKILHKDVPTVLDPVFLIGASRWKEIIHKPSRVKDYIFVYDLCGGKKLLTLARKLRQETGYDIVCATGNIKNFYTDCLSLYNIGPKELLGYICQAKYVVTDSFHGTALSLIMNTKVISYIALPHVASRIISIMELLGISDQVITDIEQFDLESINFRNYTSELEKHIKFSKAYLHTALN